VNPSILQVRDLQVYYHTRDGVVKAVNGVSFDLRVGERLGLVGESGSGKSTAASALLRLIKPPGKIEGGQVLLDGVSLLELPEEQMRQMRLREIALVAQGAMNSLNPVMRVRPQIENALRDHDVKLSSAELAKRIGDLLEQVGLRRNVADLYPHELSGGMKQRVCIAIAICLHPKVIIADEPTSALDVTVQQQILRLLRQVSEETGAALIFISHDVAVVAELCQRVLVMYAGRVVEELDVAALLSGPAHPYTRALLASVPEMATDRDQPLATIPGRPPEPHEVGEGCPFAPRCPLADDRCRAELPLLRELAPGQAVACWHPQADTAPVGQVAAEGRG
jgi:peptide/nickel transport system ATP-binding protein